MWLNTYFQVMGLKIIFKFILITITPFILLDRSLSLFGISHSGLNHIKPFFQRAETWFHLLVVCWDAYTNTAPEAAGGQDFRVKMLLESGVAKWLRFCKENT